MERAEYQETYSNKHRSEQECQYVHYISGTDDVLREHIGRKTGPPKIISLKNLNDENNQQRNDTEWNERHILYIRPLYKALNTVCQQFHSCYFSQWRPMTIISASGKI